MYKKGFLKVNAVSPILEIGNPMFNVKKMLEILNNSNGSIVVFPELSVSGYTIGDYFLHSQLLNDVKKGIEYFLENNKNNNKIVVFGAPLLIDLVLVNCAIVCQGNKILGVIPKSYLPNNFEYFEKRWFESGFNIKNKKINIFNQDVDFGYIIFKCQSSDLSFGVEICQDLWTSISPSDVYSQKGCNLIINISASNELVGKDEVRRSLIKSNSIRNNVGYVYCSSGIYESTSDAVYSNHNLVSVGGKIIAESKLFNLEDEILEADVDLSYINYQKRTNINTTNFINIDIKDFDTINVDFNIVEEENYQFKENFEKLPFVTNDSKELEKIKTILEISLYRRISHIHSKSIVLGVSGGLDSTLALLVASRMCKRFNLDTKMIKALTMPCFGTSKKTYNNALTLCNVLNTEFMEVPIKNEVLAHFELIGQNPELKDITYENTQARYRTFVLMNLANKTNGIVLGTGDLSEIALGFSTYNGDQMSMYNINCDIPKTLLKRLVLEYSLDFPELKETLYDICNTPISPELIEGQNTEDIIGTYEVNDFILYRFLCCGDSFERIKYIIEYTFGLNDEESNKYLNNFFRRFFNSQFKRQASPDGPKVLGVSLNPRTDFKLPSDMKVKL